MIQRCEKQWLRTFRLDLKQYSLYTCPRVERLGENVNKLSNTTSIKPWMILYTILMSKYSLRNSKESNFKRWSRCLCDKLLYWSINCIFSWFWSAVDSIGIDEIFDGPTTDWKSEDIHTSSSSSETDNNSNESAWDNSLFQDSLKISLSFSVDSADVWLLVYIVHIWSGDPMGAQLISSVAVILSNGL